MSNKAGIIPGDALEGWARWHPGELFPIAPEAEPAPEALAETIDGHDVAAERLEDDAEPPEPSEPVAPPPAYPTAAELEAIHQEAWQGGYDAGHAEGLTLGREEGREAAHAEATAAFAERFAPLSELGQRFEGELARVEAELAPSLLKLAFELASELSRVTVAANPDSLRNLLAEALADWREELARARVRVHPDDLSTVRAFLEAEAPATVWQWQEDAALERGGCVIDTRTVSLDLSMETRRAALAAALGLGDA
ncbi:FliH/SctL family protein [Crenobacter cavernae]|uniref:Flagellar assembly protein FliH n=1 Tax=Crenobacter cavernae TaxID=2290923 RepID=A0ABY0FG59_9NEIS|nr:FliH/SctL family protein [Crenobacter cavernae]RXZ44150.1 flagellar assembly protein FliH [Crenobacter cavernae]